MATKKTPFGTSMAGCMPVLDGAGLSSMLAPQLQMAEALIARNIETLDFLRARFERDQEMLARLSEERDPMQAMNLWSAFWQRTMSDYSSEMAKLATSASALAETAVRTATQEGEAMARQASGKR
ncbi:hypothetical protein FGG78_04475 [Thioclava sp. BHET1]|nr:hypothetical protein FGG78_04475 [Thioclava sp. BHET1]